MPDKKRTIFLTGGTGLVGSYLLKIFLEHGHKVYALVRPNLKKDVTTRIHEVLTFWEATFSQENLNIVEGDIAKNDLGIDTNTLRLLEDDVEEIFHCAAVTEVTWPLDKIRAINVEGTRKILNLASVLLKKGKLKKVDYISTAYVCGDFSGQFAEDDLQVGQKFTSTYVQSKFEAEKLIEDYRAKGIWVDIFRPTLVVGESQSGKILSFANIYSFIHYCSLEVFDTLPILDRHVHLVHVDILCNLIYSLAIHAKERNKNYHPFPKQSILITDIVSNASKLLQFTIPKFVYMKDFALDTLTPAQKNLLELSLFRLNTLVNFENSATCGLLQECNCERPEINSGAFQKVMLYYADKKRK